MISAAANTNNNRGGNGRFGTLARKRKGNKSKESAEFAYLDKADTRMRFNNAKDPIYFAFEYLENRSVSQLAGDFVKDTLFEITNFVSKVVR